ncbi:MAG: hypothetical protein D6701_01210 [Gemmatimonadetes bacterium]|nr:MAG: hypothetical protein D6701_01210 [Gemmatimonadota bacterium]
MMRQMRENTKWIMLATAAAFVGLMVFQWGMDITGRSGMGPGELGKVNGEPVLYDAYNLSYRRLYDQLQAQQADAITSQQVSELEDAAWEDAVSQILIRQELERRGIQVTDDEIRSAARFSPPPEFRTNPAFQTDGRFDIQKYQQFLSSPQVDDALLLQLEAYYRDVIPRGKLLRQVSADLYVTDQQLWDAWRDEHEAVEVRYIPLNPAQRIADSVAAVSEAEVERYYRAHLDEFAIPEQAQVQVVVIDKTPTAADTAASLEKAREIRQALLDGAEWDDILERPEVGEGSGDLGWFTRGRMVPEFEEAAFAARVGRPTEPVQTSFGFHVIEVLEKAGDSIRARHALVPIQRTEASELDLLTLADSLETLGETMPLADAAQALGLPVVPATLSQEFAFVAGAGRVSEGADWALEEAEPGEVSPVFENQQAFYMMELQEVRPAGHIPLEDARASIEQTLRFQKKLDMAMEEARGIVERIRAGEAMENVAAEAGLEIRSAGPFTRGDFVPGLGRLNAAIGAAFGLNEGEVSDPVQANNNVFILQQTAYVPADSAAWEAQKDEQRARLMASLQQARLQAWLEGLRDAADIVDRRAQVLNQGQADQPRHQQFGIF